MWLCLCPKGSLGIPEPRSLSSVQMPVVSSVELVAGELDLLSISPWVLMLTECLPYPGPMLTTSQTFQLLSSPRCHVIIINPILELRKVRPRKACGHRVAEPKSSHMS